MLNKLYAKIKNTLKEKYKIYLTFLILFLVITIELPFYLNVPGGLINISKRIKINDEHVSEKYNMAYVSEFKATIPTILWALMDNNWDILPKKEVILKNETEKLIEYRNKLLLEESNQNAIYVAFKLANKKCDISNNKVYVVYVDENSKTNLTVGDQIIKINNEKVDNKTQIQKTLSNKDINELVSFTVLNNGIETIKTGRTYNYQNKTIVGIVLSEIKDIKTDYKIEFDFKNSESGPSGGLMMTLSIYDYLIGNIDHNYKIAGTGSIDEDGNVGSIGGVKHKILGAIREKTDIFFIPSGENYEEAVEILKNKKNKLTLVKINNINEAIDYLKTLSNR